MSLRSGSTVLHYRIERRLGAGGMGEVYLAQDTKLHRQVAIKFLSAPDDERARHRLIREARAAASRKSDTARSPLTATFSAVPTTVPSVEPMASAAVFSGSLPL